MFKKLKFLWVVSTVVLGVMTTMSFGLSANAEEQESLVTGMKKVSPYILETTYLSGQTNPYQRSSNLSLNTVQYDFSEAEFFDENGNLVDKDEVMETIVPVKNIARGASTSGGSWQNGSGYAVCRGMTVTAKAGWGTFNAWFKVDFTNVQRGYDSLNRVYGAGCGGVGSWSWLSNGVFRAKETAQYSAYGGIKGQWSGAGTTLTAYSYFRVGGDRFWLESNF